MFSEHPKKVCMTYFSHFAFSIHLSFLFMIGSWKALIHAFFPFLCIKSSSELVQLVQFQLNNAGCEKKKTSSS